jgi:hypothetical protein
MVGEGRGVETKRKEMAGERGEVGKRIKTRIK